MCHFTFPLAICEPLVASAFANTWYYPSCNVVYLTVALINNFCLINSAEHYFMCLVAISMSAFVKFPLKSFAYFHLIKVEELFIYSEQKTFVKLHTYNTYDIIEYVRFSILWLIFFIFLLVYFEEQNASSLTLSSVISILLLNHFNPANEFSILDVVFFSSRIFV